MKENLSAKSKKCDDLKDKLAKQRQDMDKQKQEMEKKMKAMEEEYKRKLSEAQDKVRKAREKEERAIRQCVTMTIQKQLSSVSIVFISSISCFVVMYSSILLSVHGSRAARPHQLQVEEVVRWFFREEGESCVSSQCLHYDFDGAALIL